MARAVIVNTRHDSLAASLMKLLPDAVAASSFNLSLEEGDVLCWLPAENDPVDDQVNALVNLIDSSVMQPSRLVMLSIAGTADDASENELKQWYGHNAIGKVMAYQYAIKMIDELELPYTIVRVAPLAAKRLKKCGEAIVMAEGQQLPNEHVSISDLANILKLIVESGAYRNQSIGVTLQKATTDGGSK